MNMLTQTTATGLFALVLTLTGATTIGLMPSSTMAQPSDDWGATIPKTLIVQAEPAGAKTIGEAVTSAKVGETIVLRGRIASSKDAFQSGRAVFTIVEPLAAATETAAPDASRPAPPAAPVQAERSANVEVVDDKGRVLKTDLKNKRGLRSGTDIIVVGKVTSADGAKSLVVSATGIYIMPATLPKDLFLKDEPKDAKPVEDVKKNAKAGDTVVMRGRVGGSKEPFVGGRAVFTLIGPGLRACSDNPDDKCKVPWDYCCETRKAIVEHSATVQIVESDGSPIKIGVKGQGGVKELSDLIVVGSVLQADGKTMIVSASGVYVVKP